VNKSENKNTKIQAPVLIIIIVSFYAAALSSYNFINRTQVGYIDSNVLMGQFPSALEAKEKLSKAQEEWGSNIKTLEEELNKLNKEFIEQNAKWNKKTIIEKKKVLEKKQGDYARYTRAIREKATKKEQELMAPVFDELNIYIKEFGEEKGYDIVFGTMSGGNILYAENATDLTVKFLDFVKKKY
jgi:outer membrane protein